MSFSTLVYILVFLPAVFCACQLARRLSLPRAPQVCILVASLVFYSWAKPFNLVYLIGSVLVNWQLSQWISGCFGLSRKRVLQLGLLLNLAYLCTFKYLNFFLGIIPSLGKHINVPDLGFPLGISFFTLTQIMYLVDCYEELSPPSSLFDHATFVSFFPYVISGPISRSKRILHQFPVLNGRVGPSADVIARAMYLFCLGLIKKVVLADAFSTAADYAFTNISGLSSVEAWVGAAAYTLQIYFDFSGYSDMAIAPALLFGIEIPRNFDAPLRATSIIEYWQRWHISLTSFITTYIYAPLLKSFGPITLFTSAIATLLAMTLAGLWHGANWTFVVFGAIHGMALAINQYWRKGRMPSFPKPISWLLTYLVFQTGFVFFRAPNLQTAGLFLWKMFAWHHPWGLENLRTMDGVDSVWILILGVSQAAGVIAAFVGKSSDELSREFKPSVVNSIYATACACIALIYLNSSVAKPFVYFKF